MERGISRFPPSTLLPEELVLVRTPNAEEVVVYLPKGDSYRLSVADMEIYLHMLGSTQPSDVITLVWNFYAVHYTVASGKTRIVPYHVAREAFQESARQLPPVAAVGSGGPVKWFHT